jgi:class 3 adenylate cyclase
MKFADIRLQSLPVHRSILAVDIEKSTSPLRTNPVKQILRREVYRVLDEAMEYAGIDSRHLDPFEDRGDGVLALIHPADEVPKTLLLGAFVPAVVRLLREYNAGLRPWEIAGGLGLRLRVALHAGEVHFDGKGFFGEEVDVACRLLDAPRFKKCLAETAAPLVLVVSEDLYWSIVRHDYAGIHGADFHPLVRLKVSGRSRRGYVHLPAEAMEPAA